MSSVVVEAQIARRQQPAEGGNHLLAAEVRFFFGARCVIVLACILRGAPPGT